MGGSIRWMLEKKKKGRVSVEDNVKIERLFDVQKISSLYREK